MNRRSVFSYSKKYKTQLNKAASAANTQQKRHLLQHSILKNSTINTRNNQAWNDHCFLTAIQLIHQWWVRLTFHLMTQQTGRLRDTQQVISETSPSRQTTTLTWALLMTTKQQTTNSATAEQNGTSTVKIMVPLHSYSQILLEVMFLVTILRNNLHLFRDKVTSRLKNHNSFDPVFLTFWMSWWTSPNKN